MKHIILTAAFVLAAGTAHAQNSYLDSHNGAPPLIYNGGGPLSYGSGQSDNAPNYGNFGSLPRVPGAEGYGQGGAGPYGTTIPSGPTGYPCTLPIGCGH